MKRNNDPPEPSPAPPVEPPRKRSGGAAPATVVRDLVRDEVVLSAHTWVVKVGTSVLTGPDGTLDPLESITWPSRSAW